ncbi:MAG: DUF1538 domain-containing protein [Candidatus Borkfalkiaceae bacterium]|nr:DUF1538 domain-containing protein [Christensenellaceae bacterium]
MKKFKNSSALKEAVMAVAPITLIILIVNFFMLPQKLGAYDLVGFLFGNCLLVGGMVLYGKGIKISLEPIGEQFGSFVTRKKSLPLLLIMGALLGFIVTVAEPDLSVLGEQLGSLKFTIIITISIGVGMFLAVSLLKTMLGWNFNLLILIFYGLLFLLAIFVDKKYIPLCFDSGGVTTGALTVPFLLSFGASVAGMVGGKSKEDNSFGMVAICSIGPVIMMLALCLISRPEVSTALTHKSCETFGDLLNLYAQTALAQFKEVLIALAPITLIFFVFDFASFKLPKIQLFRILFGFLYTYVGLAVFLTGVNAAYMGTGYFIGNSLAGANKWLLIPIGAIVATFIVLAEPAVGVLVKQVEEISSGSIKKSTIRFALAISMAFALALSMLRIISGISLILIIGVGYAVALGLSFFVPNKVFTSIAFDSGGVASGPMTATFLLPFAIGAAEIIQGQENVLTYAYGLVATVALMPLITIQLMGVFAGVKQKRFDKAKLNINDDEIIELRVDL